MTHIIVKYGTVIDALGRKREGWLILENGRPGVPYATREKAVREADATWAIRGRALYGARPTNQDQEESQ